MMLVLHCDVGILFGVFNAIWVAIFVFYLGCGVSRYLVHSFIFLSCSALLFCLYIYPLLFHVM